MVKSQKNFKLVLYYKTSGQSVIRQKGESQNGGNKKTKHAKSAEKQKYLIPQYTNVRVRITE